LPSFDPIIAFRLSRNRNRSIHLALHFRAIAGFPRFRNNICVTLCATRDPERGRFPRSVALALTRSGNPRRAARTIPASLSSIISARILVCSLSPHPAREEARSPRGSEAISLARRSLVLAIGSDRGCGAVVPSIASGGRGNGRREMHAPRFLRDESAERFGSSRISAP